MLWRCHLLMSIELKKENNPKAFVHEVQVLMSIFILKSFL